VRVLIVSWEFPPLVVGGLGRHVAHLVKALHHHKHEVVVLTRGSASYAIDATEGGVRVIRAAADAIAVDFTTESVLAWSQAFEHSLVRAGLTLLDQWQPDVIHGHDWLVAQTVRTLSHLTGTPVVVTVHATEYGRQQGWLPLALQRGIHSIERWQCRSADAVITCSRFMAEQVGELFELDPTTINVIGNGIDPDVWRADERSTSNARRTYAHEDGPLIAFAGRFVHEKGIQELIKALPLLKNDFPDVRLVLAGAGHDEAEQRDRAQRYGVDDLITWPGFLDDDALATLFSAADVVVVPSVYEPFGLVALEAQATGTPVAVTDTGGLRDLVEPGVTGERFAPQSPNAIADAVTRLLKDPARATYGAGRPDESPDRLQLAPHRRVGGRRLRNSPLETKGVPANTHSRSPLQVLEALAPRRVLRLPLEFALRLRVRRAALLGHHADGKRPRRDAGQPTWYPHRRLRSPPTIGNFRLAIISTISPPRPSDVPGPSNRRSATRFRQDRTPTSPPFRGT